MSSTNHEHRLIESCLSCKFLKTQLEGKSCASHQSPTVGAHAHPCPWVLGGHGCDIIVHWWAWWGIGYC